jgi:hypothetical protein
MAAMQVLLARPHAFIVAEMLPFLSRALYAPKRLDSLVELESLNPSSFAGVVISTAVISSINASADEVFTAVRRKMPRVPIIFAGLTEFSIAGPAVERIVKKIYPAAEVVPVSSSTADSRDLGRDHVFVVMNKEDLGGGSALANAEKILRKHFRG